MKKERKKDDGYATNFGDFPIQTQIPIMLYTRFEYDVYE